ncbi:somatostatin receptor type 5-like [Actinia tenebrosa]|uniref:Somatostatin receptor type 5-like n=1 Tax=Actinia tenebrosa TaxID=6105 RepID=A0A6P8I7R8_ACTTE|nr:somatostatin receptor type 5-like [Actinia tenebrosa]XP_031561108.1 somatostatin receptor type 5-like [Actinia tenebrosa]XP_031561110.1 somatostatin receptor type 5-like [Actinia tenebrosa]XP_031561111.1 somatostatin receptor type 5-like [Actinia tenebrosa]XP_031561112.1 somatostatin receptor type 5-like [Actinia tenebrosa]
MRNDTLEDQAMSATKVVRLVLYITIFLFGSFGNLLVIIVVHARGKKRTFHDYFLLNLAIADLLFILCLPADIYVEMTMFPFTEIYCKLIYPLTTFGFSLSIFTLTSMAVGRCYIMKHHNRPPIRGRIVMFWIILLWIFSILCVLPLSVVAQSAPDACQEDWPERRYRLAYTAALCVLQYIAPLCIIAIAYVHIGIQLNHKKPPSTDDNKTAQIIALRIRQRNIQIMRTLAVIVVLFALLMLPHEIAWLLIDFGRLEHDPSVQILIKFSPILTYLHSCSNPLVYGLMISQFRDDARKCLCCVKLEGFPECYEHENASRRSKTGTTSPKPETKLVERDPTQKSSRPVSGTSSVYANKPRVETELLITKQYKGICQTKFKKNSNA